MTLVRSHGIGKNLLAYALYRVNHVPGLFCKACYRFVPSPSSRPRDGGDARGGFQVPLFVAVLAALCAPS